MSLYKLVAKDYTYNCYDAKIVRAATLKRAREIASRNAGAEGKQIWLDPRLSIATKLTTDGEEGELLGSFNAG